jgi:hypothetical protein
LLFVVAFLMGACGSAGPDPQENPQAALTSAFESLRSGEGVAMTVSFRSDIASLQAISEGELSEEDAQKILDSSFSVTGRNESDPKNAQAEISVDIAGIDDAVQMRVLGTTLYLRGDVRGIMETFGADPADADQFVADGKTAGIDWAEPAIDGGWLEISGMDELGKQFGAPGLDQTATQQQEMLNKFTASIEKNAKAKPGDEEGPGDHLIVTVNIRDMYASLAEIAGSLGTAAGAGMPPADTIPDETVDIDLWIEDDYVRQMEFDFRQLSKFEDADMPEGVEQAALRITMEEFDGEVEAPEDATKVDMEQLMQLMFAGTTGGAGMGSGEGTPSPSDICEQLAGAPPEVVEQFAEECPELQT